MNDWGRIRIGIETSERRDGVIVSPTEMRQAIAKAMHESHLVRNIMYAADYAGATAEDRYTMLAYHSLVALETYYQKCLQMTMLFPSPIVMPAGNAGEPV